MSKVIREDPILLLLSLPHVLSIFSKWDFQVWLCFLSRSPLPLNAKLPAMLYFQHFLTSQPPTPLPTSPSSPVLHPGFYQVWAHFHFSLYCSTLPLPWFASSFLFPLLLQPSPFLFITPHIHSSIPQLPPLRTSAIINLVQPQELGHRGTLKRVTL